MSTVKKFGVATVGTLFDEIENTTVTLLIYGESELIIRDLLRYLIL